MIEPMNVADLRIERLTTASPEGDVNLALTAALGELPDEVQENLTRGLMLRIFHLNDAGALGELWQAVRRDDGAFCGAVWAQPKPGGTAIVWPPQWFRPPDGNDRDPLLVALLEKLTADGIVTAQSLVSDPESAEARTLLRCGFTKLAELNYMAASVASAEAEAAMAVATVLRFAPFAPGDFARMAELVDATYCATLDCPGVDGLRSTTDVLDEYRTIGTAGDTLWRFVRAGDRDVGCLLAADHPQQDQIELVYMGLVPDVRGRGWGMPTVGEVLRIARTLQRARVVLAVDSTNWPAKAMYERAGFATFDTRTALMFRPLPAAGKS